MPTATSWIRTSELPSAMGPGLQPQVMGRRGGWPLALSVFGVEWLNSHLAVGTHMHSYRYFGITEVSIRVSCCIWVSFSDSGGLVAELKTILDLVPVGSGRVELRAAVTYIKNL